MSCNDGHGNPTMGLDDDSRSGRWWLGDVHGAQTMWHAEGTRYTGVHTEVQRERSMEVLRNVVGDVSLRLGGGRTPLWGTRGQMGLWLQPCWASRLCPGLVMGPGFQMGGSKESRGRESGWDRVKQRMYYDQQMLGQAYGVYSMGTKVWWTKYQIVQA